MSRDYFESQLPLKSLGDLRIPAIYGIGLNYRSYAESIGLEIPKRPLLFSKPSVSATVAGEPIEIPTGLSSAKVDYEGELAVIIGQTCKNATLENAMSYVAGYTASIDVTARDWQFELGGGQFTKGKGFDTFTPLGPELVSADSIPDPKSLSLTTHVNGELRQQGRLSDLIFGIPEIIVFLSGSTTLLSGTVILTGTPGGVGHSKKPPVYLQEGDDVVVSIESIGQLKRSVVLEA